MIHAALRRQVLADLAEISDELGGRIPKFIVCDRADQLGVHVSTVYRWLKDVGRTSPVEHSPSLADEHIDVVFAHCGNLTRAKAELDRDFPEIAEMSMSTFRRRWFQLDPALRAMAKDGAQGLMAFQLRNRWAADHRNDHWHIDHHELPIWVLPAGSSTPVKPWCTTIEDSRTRRLMAVLLTMERPSTEHVAVALADAMRTQHVPGHGEVGGVPKVLHSDNGGEFKSGQYIDALGRLGIQRKVSYPHMKQQNGKVERLQGTMQDRLVAALPGFANGPSTLRGAELYGLHERLMDERAFAELFYAWPDEYNNTPHSSLDGKTPNEVWFADPTPLRKIDPELVRLAMLKSRRKTYKVHPSGVHFNNVYYTSPELRQWVGRQVTVRFMPSDNSFVDLFDGETWICTALPHEDLTDEQRAEMLAIRKQQYTESKGHTKAAADRRLIQHGFDPLFAKPQSTEPQTEASASDEALFDLLDEEE